MAGNSLPRRAVKRLLAPVLGERSYSVIQALTMSWDIRTRTWWEPELEIIEHAVQRGDTALDIGANFGLYAHYLSRHVGDTGKVYCFEPLPFTNRTFRLISSLLRFKNVELIEKGCSDKAGIVNFAVPVMSTGAVSAGLVHMAGRDDARPGKERHAQFEKTKDVRCEVIAIDEYLPNLKNVSLIKCDIEGADLFAMRGARRTIQAHKPTVICEINPWFLEGFGLKVDDLVGFFGELGYELYRYENRTLWPTKKEDVVEDNWVFVHPERHARLGALLTSERTADTGSSAAPLQRTSATQAGR